MKNPAPVSPLRYPGAKRWIAGYISKSLIKNNLKPSVFVEPFAGGASVSLSLLNQNLVKKIILVDRDPLIAAFWHTVFFDTDWLLKRILETEVTLDLWYKIKASHPSTTRDLAFKCLYLNRTSFSGLLTPQVGPLGGKSQKSKYKIDCRFNKVTMIKRLRRVSEFRDKVLYVWNLHWKTALGKIKHMQDIGSISKSSFFYFDPPFYNKAKSLYTFYFQESDHLSLRDYLIDFNNSWILSYDFCPEIISMYKNGNFNACQVDLLYTASKNGRSGNGKEVIVSNLPNMVSRQFLGTDKTTTNPQILSEFLTP